MSMGLQVPKSSKGRLMMSLNSGRMLTRRST